MPSYHVTAPIRFTVDANSTQGAISRVVDAAVGLVTSEGPIASLHLDEATFECSEINHDPDDLAAMQRWLDTNNPA